MTDEREAHFTVSQTRREIAKELARTMPCNCDLDRWQPEPLTGHSWVCRIHKRATKINRALVAAWEKTHPGL